VAKRSPGTVFLQCKVYVDIFTEVLWRGASNDTGLV